MRPAAFISGSLIADTLIPSGFNGRRHVRGPLRPQRWKAASLSFIDGNFSWTAMSGRCGQREKQNGYLSRLPDTSNANILFI